MNSLNGHNGEDPRGSDSPAGRYRLGIDIGGTFTDLALLDRRTGTLRGHKTPTVPEDQSQGVKAGLSWLDSLGIDLSQVEYCAHGTTVGLNTLLQRSGAELALLTTSGFRDILEIARLRLPNPWDFYSRRAVPLIPRERVLEVAERVRHDGVVVDALTAGEIERIADAVDELEVDAVAIVLLHAYANADHERALRAELAARSPDLLISCSSDLWPESREYERALVTMFNAYVQPELSAYLGRVSDVCEAAGLPNPPYVTRSNGGVMTLEAARSECVHTLLSGPAAGVIGATNASVRAGFTDLITFDMGGTSADVAIVQKGEIGFSREEHVGDFPIIMPVIGISSIGMGGGSVAWLDSAGVLKVGPESAGANPGPACYGLGGTRPTIADALLLCGYLNPKGFVLQGRLDESAAREALRPLAAGLDLDVADAATAIIRVALAGMFTELTAVLDRQGLDPRDFSLVAFGGAGPVLACQLAEMSSVGTVLVPSHPGTLCASGAIQANIRGDFVASCRQRIDDAEGYPLEPLYADPHQRAEAWIAGEAPPVAEVSLSRTADLRYVGQAYELEIPMDEKALAGEFSTLQANFHSAHAKRFGHDDPTTPIEIVNLRVSAVGHLPRADGAPQSAAPEGGVKDHTPRDLTVGGRSCEARVIERHSLGAGETVMGPVILEQMDTTTVVSEGWTVLSDETGILVLRREG